MTLEDFGDPVSELAQKILSRSKSELHRRMVSDDPEVRLAAYKESLAQKVRVIDEE